MQDEGCPYPNKRFADGRTAWVFACENGCWQIRRGMWGFVHEESWAFLSEREAIVAMEAWDGRGDPPGFDPAPWLKVEGASRIGHGKGVIGGGPRSVPSAPIVAQSRRSRGWWRRPR